MAMSLPKDLYPLSKDQPIPWEWLLSDEINASVNNIKVQQKASKVDKTYFNPIFLNKINKSGRDFLKVPGNISARKRNISAKKTRN